MRQSIYYSGNSVKGRMRLGKWFRHTRAGSLRASASNGDNFMSGYIYKRELDALFTSWNNRLNAA